MHDENHLNGIILARPTSNMVFKQESKPDIEFLITLKFRLPYCLTHLQGYRPNEAVQP